MPTRAPLVVFLHGGGWLRGSRKVFTPGISDAQSFDRIVAAGFAVASCEYRLSGEARFPAQLDDVDAALAWLQAHGAEHGVDASRIVLWGVSAGATLAALTRPASRRRARCRGLVRPGRPVRDGRRTTWGMPPDETREARWLGAPAAELPDAARLASPALQVHAGAPPFHISHGTADEHVPFAQSEALAAALRARRRRRRVPPGRGRQALLAGPRRHRPRVRPRHRLRAPRHRPLTPSIPAESALVPRESVLLRPESTSMNTASMIAPAHPTEAAPLLRREFALDEGHGAVERATLRTSALGVVEAWVNGIPSSDELLAPGWTSYEWRVRLVEHDVTDAVAERTVIGLRLGNGWWRGWLGFTGAARGVRRRARRLRRARDRASPTGTCRPSSPTSRGGRRPARCSPTTSTTARRSTRACATTRGCIRASTTAGWDAVHVVDFDAEPPRRRRASPPVRRLGERRRASASGPRPSGKTLVDFGQNLVGFVRVRVAGPAGTEVVLRHAEVLEHGELGTRPLRRAEATDRFILSGGDDVFEPTLTFHGFRYVEVTGWPGELDPAALTAVVVGTDIAPIGSFACSDPLLNQLHSNVVWGMRGNFLSVPDRLPAARRAPGLDRRPRGLRADGGVPRRRRVVPRRLAGRCRARASRHARADRPRRRAERHEVPRHRLSRARRHRGLGRRRGVGAVGALARRTATSRRCATRTRS